VPIFAIRKNIQLKVQQSIRRGTYVMISVNGSSCLALAVAAYFGSRTFNIAMFVYVIGQILAIFAVSGYMIFYARELRRQVFALGLESRETMNKKVDSIIRGSASFAVGSVPTVVALLAMWTIGSAPYLWVSCFVVFLTTPASLATITLGIFKQYESNSSSKSKMIAGEIKSSNEHHHITTPPPSSVIDVRPL
jgi:hypothetical protein